MITRLVTFGLQMRLQMRTERGSMQSVDYLYGFTSEHEAQTQNMHWHGLYCQFQRVHTKRKSRPIAKKPLLQAGKYLPSSTSVSDIDLSWHLRFINAKMITISLVAC